LPWRLPHGDDDLPMRWRLISRFSRSLRKDERRSQSRACKNGRGIGQGRNWEQLVRSEAHFQRCLEYHYNPFKHGYAPGAVAWPHSSFRYWADRGVHAMDWRPHPRTT
jgi:putative transposase